MKKILASTLISLTLMSPVTFADQITEQIQTALTAYEDKDYKTAVEELKFATVQLEKLKNKQNQTLLPKPLEGWKIIQSDNSDNQMAMSIMGGGTTIKGKYQREKETIEIEVLANSPLLPMMTMMLNNPAMMASDKNIKPYRYKKAKGMIKKSGNKTEMTLLLAGQIMLKITGHKLKDDEVLKQYLEVIDLNKLKEALL